MNSRKLLLPLLLIGLAASSAYAGGGFLQTLPKDGTWVEYNVEMKAEAGPMQEMSGTMKLKSVGTVTENGEKYRWFEIVFKGESNGMKQDTIIKALIREKELKAGAKAKSDIKILRGWQQATVGDKKMDPKELSEIELSGKGPVSFFFGPNLKKVEKVKKAKEIVYQKGKLKLSEATTGELDLNFNPNAPEGFKQKGKQTIWKHKSIPTGAAALEVQMEVHNKDKLVMKMRMMFNVQDYGKGAKSALPDKK